MRTGATRPLTGAASPSQEAIDRQRLALFEDGLAGLPERARQALVLSRLHGWPYPKIAANRRSLDWGLRAARSSP